MERRRAIAVAASAALTATTLAVAVAATSGSGLLGFGGSASSAVGDAAVPTTAAEPLVEAVPVSVTDTLPLDPVVVTEVVYDDQYVVVPTTPPATDPVPAPEPAPVPAPSSTAPPATAPRATTPAPSTTPTTGAPGELPEGFRVSDEWPPGEPYPPIPAGCERGVLEDDGRWNCQWSEEDDD